MSWIDIVSVVLNLLLGGGLIVTLTTLKSARKQAEEQAKGVSLDNDTKASQTLIEYVVNPLKMEMKTLRREITRFRKAVETIPTCKYADDCPVDKSLHTDEEEINQ